MIPKIIHQTWFDNNKTLPIIFDKMIQESKKINQNYEFKLWTDANIEDFSLRFGPRFAPHRGNAAATG